MTQDFDLFNGMIKQMCETMAKGMALRGVDPNGVDERNILAPLAVKGLGEAGIITEREVPVNGIYVDVGIYHPHEFGLVEIKNSATRSVVEDRPRLVEAMKAVPEWRFSAICFLHCDGHWRTPYKLYLPTLQSDADRDTWHCEQIMLPDNVPTRYVKSYICARSFQRA